MWAKPLFIAAVLARNYTVLYSDLDTVWLKDALRSFATGLDEHDADMVGMNDQNSGNPNAGNIMLRPSSRVRALMAEWTAAGLRSDIHDQEGLWRLKGKRWLACGDASACLEARAKGMVALWLHPWHGCPWEVKFDASHFSGGICDNRLAYVHIFCTDSGVRHKTGMASSLGLWFVDKGSDRPLMHGARAQELVEAQPAHSIPHSPAGLPCPNEVAWLGL